jgi:cysteine desulfurase/selenocysteine lyase
VKGHGVNGHSTNGRGAGTRGPAQSKGHSNWVVPDEKMLARLADEVIASLAGPELADATENAATPWPDQEQPDQPDQPAQAAQLSPDRFELPVSTGTEEGIPAPVQPARAATAARPPAPPAPGTASGSPSFYFIEERSELGATAQAPRPPARATEAAAGTGWPGLAVEAVRRDFPILAERVNGRRLVWFDNAATTHKPQSVIDRIAYFYAHENSNVHRGAHTLAARATDAYEDARSTVARYIGAPSADDIVFTRGTTESINLVASSWGGTHIGPGDEIAVSHLEHHANIVPWQRLAEATGARLRVIPVDDDGQVLLDGLGAELSHRTKLVAVAHVSNVLGTVVPVEQVIAMAHQAGARVLVDGAQAVAHLPVQVSALDADFYVFSGHKVFGPTGIGVLYAKPELLDEMPPWQSGGNMIADVTFERTRYQQAPAKFEAGTGNIAGAVGLGAALKYVTRLGLPAVTAYEHQLHEYATRQITAVPGLRLVGTAARKASVLTFTLEGHQAQDIGTELDRQGIAVRAGHHCAQPILRRYGLQDAVRPSLALYNTCAEVDQLVAALHRIAAS